MKFYKLLFIFLFCFHCTEAQVSDFRDAFTGLYHSTNSNGWNSAIQSPYPHVYILVEKSLTSTDSIIITDTMQSAAPYRRYAKLNTDSTWYSFSGYHGHFKNQDSIYCASVFPGPSWAYYDGKRISPVAIREQSAGIKNWYLFPNPSNSSITVLLPDVTEDLTLHLHDLSGKEIFSKAFRNNLVVDVAAMPRGVYLARITGISVSLSQRLVLMD